MQLLLIEAALTVVFRGGCCCRHTHRFLLTYITFLPFALWPLYEWATLPIMAVTGFLLLGVENIGKYLLIVFLLF